MSEIKRKELKLEGATEVSRLHPDQLNPPEMAKLRNVAISRSDLLPGLRPDLVLSGSRPVTVAADWDPVMDDEPDFLNRLIWSFNNQAEVYISRMWPFTTSAGEVTELVETYATGTVSAHADSVNAVAGTSTAWFRNVWPGCWLKIDGYDTYFLITEVVSDTVLTVASAIDKGVSGDDYAIYKTWHPDLGLWPVKHERFGFYSIIKPVRPTAPVDAATVCGPFYSAVETEDLRSDEWVEQVLSFSTLRAYAGCYANSYNVVAGGYDGKIIYALDSDYYTDPASGAELLTWSAGATVGGTTAYFYAVDGGDDAAGTGTFFVAVGTTGMVYTAGSTPNSWTSRTSGTTNGLSGVVVNPGFDGTAIAVGTQGKVIVSTNDGATWVSNSISTTSALMDVAVAPDSAADSTVIITGQDGTCYRASSDGMAAASEWASVSWTDVGAAAMEDFILSAVYGAGRADAAMVDTWMAVGYASTTGLEESCVFLSTDDGLTWSRKTTPAPPAGARSYLYDVTYSADQGLWVVSEQLTASSSVIGRRILTSPDGSNWEVNEIDGTNRLDGMFEGAVNGAAVVIAPQANGGRVYYSSAPLSITFADFVPVSADTFRAHAFCVAGGYCVYGCTREYDSGPPASWDLYPMRIRWSAPGEVANFAGAGAGFADLKGTGQILDLCAVGTSIIVGETDRISCLSPGIVSTWEHRPLAAGLWQLSNMVEVNEVAYFIGSDGLLYGATPAGVQRVETGFDLSVADDWEVVSSEPISISYSGSLQCLVIFRAADPYRLHLVEPVGGQHAVWELPSFEFTATDYTPRMAASMRTDDADRLLVSYGETETRTMLTSLEADFDGKVDGLDELTGEDTYDEGKWHATYQTGLLRFGGAGETVEIKDVEVHVYCWPDQEIDDLDDGSAPTVTGPDIAVEVRANGDDDWRSLAESGTITATENACTGTGTTFSNKVGEGDDATVAFTTPCRAAKARVYLVSGGTYTATTAYTITGTHEITFTAAPATGQDVYVFWSGEPRVSAAVGDYICTAIPANELTTDYSLGWHRITEVTDFRNLVLDWYPLGSRTIFGRLVKAQQATAGRNVLTFGIGAKVEELELRITVIPREGSTAALTTRPIRAVVSYVETGDETKNDE